MIRIHSVLLLALIYRGCCLFPLPPLKNTHAHTHIGRRMHSEGPRSIDEPNEESSCFSAYLLNSISPTRSPCRIHLLCLSIYPSICLSTYLSICPYLFTRLSIHIPILSFSQCLHLSLYLSIYRYTGSDWPDWSLLCIQGLFIFQEVIRGLKTGNLIKWLPWFKRIFLCVCVQVCLCFK